MENHGLASLCPGDGMSIYYNTGSISGTHIAFYPITPADMSLLSLCVPDGVRAQW